LGAVTPDAGTAKERVERGAGSVLRRAQHLEGAGDSEKGTSGELSLAVEKEATIA
jgi:hypothetical protein